MRSFPVGAAEDWELVGLGELVRIQGGPEARLFSARFLTDAPVSVYLDDDAGRRLVAYGTSLLRVKASVQGEAGFLVEADDRATVYVFRRQEPQVVPDKGLVSFATIEPRAAGPSADVRRMMLAMRLNEERRELIVSAERERLNARISDLEKQAKAGARSKPEAKPEAGEGAEAS